MILDKYINYIDSIIPGLKSLPSRDIVFQIENQIDYQPNISFIKGNAQSRSHINLLTNLTVSLYLGDYLPENYYTSLNLTFDANFRVFLNNYLFF